MRGPRQASLFRQICDLDAAQEARLPPGRLGRLPSGPRPGHIPSPSTHITRPAPRPAYHTPRQASLAAGGFYAQQLVPASASRPGLRLVAINTNLYSTVGPRMPWNTPWSPFTHPDPRGQFAWRERRSRPCLGRPYLGHVAAEPPP